MERIVMTMPIAPYHNFSVGKLSTPILAKSLAIKLNAKYVLAVNCLDAYKTRGIMEYMDLLHMYDLDPDEYWIDSEHREELLQQIYYLIDNNYIYSSKRDILSCHCKRVEIPIQHLDSINMNDACFYRENGNYYCKYCHSICCVNEMDSLIFNPKLVTDCHFNFYPDFINKDIKTFHKNIFNNEMIISRERDTGISLDYHNNIYHIDIDFLWGVYLSLFSNKDKIVMCSNHQLYQLYLVTLLEKCFSNEGQTISLATPYFNLSDKNLEKELDGRILSLQLFSIFNQKWSKKENVFDEGLLKFINTMNVEKKEMLYRIVMEEVKDSDMLLSLKKILREDFNLQNANKVLKRRRVNV